MEIRIDESGTFKPVSPQTHRVSAVGALIFATKRKSELYAEYSQMRGTFPRVAGEVKGAGLAETHIAAVVQLLARYDVLFDASVSDVANHRLRDLKGFQEHQAQRVTASLTPEHRPTLVAQVHDLAARLRALHPQLFAQFCLTVDLVLRVLDYAPLYYVQRLPEELGSFTWIFDAKDRSLTEYEALWSSLILPMITARSIEQPHPMIEEADYSHFARFVVPASSPRVRALGNPPDPSQRVIDVKKLLKENLSFADSKTDLGLEMVDILTNALARAMNGRLQPAGWRELGGLMVGKRGEIARPFLFRAQGAARGRVVRVADSYHGVTAHLNATCKNMFSERFAEEHPQY